MIIYWILLSFCLGFFEGYLIRLFVEDTDREFEMMEEYQKIIEELIDDE